MAKAEAGTAETPEAEDPNAPPAADEGTEIPAEAAEEEAEEGAQAEEEAEAERARAQAPTGAREARNLPITRRAAEAVPATIDIGARTVDVVWSAGADVLRYDWWDDVRFIERLDMKPASVRLDRLNKGAPLLRAHEAWDLDAVIGNIVPGTAKVDGKRGTATVHFGDTPDAERYFQLMRQGVLRFISVGYATYRQEIDDTQNPPVRTATDWEPFEISIVPVPADADAAFRAHSPHPSPRPQAAITQESRMDVATPGAAQPAAVDPAAIAAIRAEERERSAGIRETVRKLGLPVELGDKHEKEGTTLDAFRTLAIDAAAASDTRGAPSGGAQHAPEVDEAHRHYAAAENEPKGINIGRFLIAVAATDRSRMDSRGVADWAAKRWGPRGVIVSRALSVSLGSAGGFTVPADMGQELIPFLRAASVIMSFGPRILPMPNGNISVPRMDGGSTATYVGELGSSGATQPKFGMVDLVAKKLNAWVPLSKDMIRYPSIDVESQVRDDAVRAVAQRGDLAGMFGDGSNNTPRGIESYILGDKGVKAANYIEATAQGASESQSQIINRTRQDLGKLKAALKNANIPMTKCGWTMDPTREEFLLNLSDGVGGLAFGEEMFAQKTLLGYPWRRSTQVPSNRSAASGSNNTVIQFGDYGEFYVGEAQQMEVSVFDQATYVDASGKVVNMAQADMIALMVQTQHDFGMRQKYAFAELYAVGGTGGQAQSNPSGFWQ